MQYGRKLARIASQARLFDRISLGGVAGGTIDFYISVYVQPFPVLGIFTHEHYQLTSAKREIILIGYFYDNLIREI